MGLALSPEKSKHISFSGNTYNPRKLRLRLGDDLMQTARVLSFLGVTLEEGRAGVAETTAILIGSRGAEIAISHMARFRWGSSTPIALKAHKDLVASRICYSLPYYRHGKRNFSNSKGHTMQG